MIGQPEGLLKYGDTYLRRPKCVGSVSFALNIDGDGGQHFFFLFHSFSFVLFIYFFDYLGAGTCLPHFRERSLCCLTEIRLIHKETVLRAHHRM